MSTKAPIILAVDTSDLELAKAWIAHTSEYVQVFKLGLEFFLNFGPQGIRAITENTDAKIFLDLKLHDIPNTVAHAAASAALLKPFLLTVMTKGKDNKTLSKLIKEVTNKVYTEMANK